MNILDICNSDVCEARLGPAFSDAYRIIRLAHLSRDDGGVS